MPLETPENSKVLAPQEAKQNRAEIDRFDLDSMEIGESVEIKTRGRIYTLKRRWDGYYLSGHPTYCQEPTKIMRGTKVVQPGNKFAFFVEVQKPGEAGSEQARIETSPVETISEK